jgi:hypothetical protein
MLTWPHAGRTNRKSPSPGRLERGFGKFRKLYLGELA